MKFIVEGKPQGKARARTFYNARVGKMQSITPEQTKSYEDLIRWKYRAAGGQYMGEKVLQVRIEAFYPTPKAFSKAKINDAIDGKIRPTTKLIVTTSSRLFSMLSTVLLIMMISK